MKKVYLIILSVVVLIMVAIAGGIGFYVASRLVENKKEEVKSEEHVQQKKEDAKTQQSPKPSDVKTTENSTVQNQASLEQIVVSVYTPTDYDHTQAPFYIVIKNTANQYFEGKYELQGIYGVGPAAGTGTLKLYPQEVKMIKGSGNIPEQVHATIKGDFSGKVLKNDLSIDYTIVKTDLVGNKKQGHGFFFVYLPPGLSDDIYIAIAKEFKINYAKNYPVITVRFAPVFVGQTTYDTCVIYANNNIAKFSHMTFFDDESNTDFQEEERKTVDI